MYHNYSAKNLITSNVELEMQELTSDGYECYVELLSGLPVLVMADILNSYYGQVQK